MGLASPGLLLPPFVCSADSGLLRGPGEGLPFDGERKTKGADVQLSRPGLLLPPFVCSADISPAGGIFPLGEAVAVGD